MLERKKYVKNCNHFKMKSAKDNKYMKRLLLTQNVPLPIIRIWIHLFYSSSF